MDNKPNNAIFKWIGLGLLLVGLIVTFVAAISYSSWEGSAIGIALLLVGGFIFAKS